MRPRESSLTVLNISLRSMLRHLSGQLRHRLSSGSAATADAAAEAALTAANRAGQGSAGGRVAGGRRIRPARSASPFSSSRIPAARYYYLPQPPVSRPLDVARFGLLCVATLPFTVWIACFTYDYVYRVEICQDALGRQDDDLVPSDSSYRRSSSEPANKSASAAAAAAAAAADDASSGDADIKTSTSAYAGTVRSTTLLGRDKELAEVSSLLDKEPSQIIVIAGGNEAGKSRFVSELLQSPRQLSSNRGITYVQLAQLVDSVSSFTQVLVNAFDLRWLRLRHALVDVLPFAGSEILVMKERFGDRDLAQCLAVITDSLKRYAAASDAAAPDAKNTNRARPVIVIDGFGEGPGQWMSTSEGRLLAQRFLQWCIYVTKERRLAHVVLTGNEQLVLSLTDQNRVTRGHVKVVGLGDLSLEDAAQIVQTEIPDASDEEIGRITGVFGGFIHDVKGVSRDVQYRLNQEGTEAAVVGSKTRKAVLEGVIKARFQQQVERVIAAFAQGKERDDAENSGGGGADEEEDMDPYLDPLKSIYSEAAAGQKTSGGGGDGDASDDASWTQLQLWKTLQRLIESPNMSVKFSELRDDVFGGDKRPILELISEDVLGFQVDRSSDGGWFWKVTPASPCLRKAFATIVKDGVLKERFDAMEVLEEQIEERMDIENERARHYRERKVLDLRKKSLLRTLELGRQLGDDDFARTRLAPSFEAIVAEEGMHDAAELILREKLSVLVAGTKEAVIVESSASGDTAVRRKTTDAHDDHSLPLQTLLKEAVLDMISSPEDAGNDRFSRLREAFNKLDETKDGKIAAVDLVRVVKEATGKEVDMADARDLIAKWDLDKDRTLDYNEFSRMLLADRKESNTPSKGTRDE